MAPSVVTITRGPNMQRRPRACIEHVRSRAGSRTFEALPTISHAFFAPSFEEGNMAKRQKLEPEFEEVSEPSQLSGPFPKAT